jgi:catechol 2,3-dioxygenase-like lactoylglutathione lyase family enzyme
MQSMSPAITGIHHVTFVVTDLETGKAWFGRVFDAEHVARFDHHDTDGTLFGIIIDVPGFPGMVELRLATPGYPRPTVGYDPITFEVADDAAIDDWVSRLDELGVAHSPKKQRRTGSSLEFSTPDGTLLRLFTAPEGGFDKVQFQEDQVDP